MEKVTLGISGMTCGGCVKSVTRVLDGMAGVAKADVSLDKRCAVVDYDPSKVGVEQLKRAVVEAGYEITS